MSNSLQDLADVVRERRFRLGDMTQQRVAELGGPSTETQRLIEGAKQGGYSHSTLRKMDRGLGWPSGTTLRFLKGEVPPVEREELLSSAFVDEHGNQTIYLKGIAGRGKVLGQAVETGQARPVSGSTSVGVPATTAVTGRIGGQLPALGGNLEGTVGDYPGERVRAGNEAEAAVQSAADKVEQLLDVVLDKRSRYAELRGQLIKAADLLVERNHEHFRLLLAERGATDPEVVRALELTVQAQRIRENLDEIDRRLAE